MSELKYCAELECVRVNCNDPTHAGSDEDATCRPQSVVGDVHLRRAVTKGIHPAWFPPSRGVDTGLKLLNSLTGELEPFIPGNGRRVLWYTCGPTVYDSCHMGHARAYLTFDILRRIMEDYFGYEVLFQCNITDIDDKIILRSRRNLLIQNYAEANSDFNVVLKDISVALEEKLKKLETAWSAARDKPLNVSGSPEKDKREQEERETQLKSMALKQSQALATGCKLQLVAQLKKQGFPAIWQVLTDKANVAANQASSKPAQPKAVETKTTEATKGAEAKLPDRPFAPVLKQLAAVLSTSDVDAARAFLKNELRNVTHEDERVILYKFDDDLIALDLVIKRREVMALIEIGNDELGDLLDSKLKATVTDHSVFMSHARKYEKEYMEDMSRLGIRDPDVLTRVTEYVPKIIDYVKAIIDKGFAYEANGSVYLSIEEFKKQGHSYRKCDPFQGDTSAESMAESEGALSDEAGKRHKNDFALWKCSKPGEPEWVSPWGKGRPGWHIECSVVASDIMGGNMDLHAGGSDLKFPHHDNELAQSEAFYGHNQWVNYFIHAGHLHIKGLKMAKSLKNFIKIREALEEHTPRQLRLMFLMSPWYKPMNYSDQAMNEAKAKEANFKNFFGTVKSIARDPKDPWVDKQVGWNEQDRALYTKVAKMEQTVHASLCNNFDTVAAMTDMTNMITEINKYLISNKTPAVYLLKKAAMYITRILRIFGVADGCDDIGWSTSEGGDYESKIGPFVDAVVDLRNEIRNEARKMTPPHVPLLTLSDRIRDEVLIDLGVSCTDQSDGASRWALENPTTLRKNLELKRKLEQETAQKKLAAAIAKQEAVLAKLRENAIPPQDMFRSAEYSAYDAQGLPTLLANGAPVSQGSLKKLQKLREKRQAQLETGEDTAALIAKEEAKLADLRRQTE